LSAVVQVTELKRENAQLKADLAAVTQQLDWFKRQLFGAKSEKRLDVDPAVQGNLLDALDGNYGDSVLNPFFCLGAGFLPLLAGARTRPVFSSSAFEYRQHKSGFPELTGIGRVNARVYLRADVGD
jgi:hypothetical protein